MKTHLKYLVERNIDDFGYELIGRVNSLSYARALAMSVCQTFPGAIVEISEVDETNLAKYLETIDGCEIAA